MCDFVVSIQCNVPLHLFRRSLWTSCSVWTFSFTQAAFLLWFLRLTLLEVGFLDHISHLELLVHHWPWIKLLNLEVSGTSSAFYSAHCAHAQQSFSRHCFFLLQQQHCFYANCYFQPHRQGPISNIVKWGYYLKNFCKGLKCGNLTRHCYLY